MSLVKQITQVNMFKRGKGANGQMEWRTGHFIGRPFRLSYSKAELLVADAWKQEAGGIPQGCFLLAYYDNNLGDTAELEALLLRVIEPTALPTEPEVISSMVEYYKDNIRTGSNSTSQLDSFTRYEFSFSGLRCSILGSFYLDSSQVVRFGADVENFFSAHNYSVVKPSAEILRFIVNYRTSGVPGSPSDIRVGKVRYSSSRHYAFSDPDVPVYVTAQDFAGKRTALFGMTRTGKSNTVKKIIQACVEMSEKAPLVLDKSTEASDEILQPFTSAGLPKYPVGQIIFDINGEYANANLQDAGTAIFDMYQDRTVRYSTLQKPGFRVMKVNFYKEIESGFDLIRSYPAIVARGGDYLINFLSVDLQKPEDYDTDFSEKQRYDRRLAAYLSVLYKARFEVPPKFKVSFTARQEIRDAVDPSIDLSKPITLEDAASWFEKLWSVYDDNGGFRDKKTNKEWADDELKALLAMLTRRKKSGRPPDVTGYSMLTPIAEQHTAVQQAPFDDDILEQLRKGHIVIVDLSLGDEDVQRMFSERITRRIFQDAMQRFTSTKPNNFIQFYFEEAHNLFPKKEDKDLSQIYNRLAKEGAKLHLGLIYATQEVSSISSNILKATQNWFISHLNNEDEIKELRKYYDFSDFTEALIRFSQDTDKGFVRMKTYSNAFVVPVQIDRFPPETPAPTAVAETKKVAAAEA